MLFYSCRKPVAHLWPLPGFENCDVHHAVYRVNRSDAFAVLVPQQRLHALTCAWSCSRCWRRACARSCSLVVRGLKILQCCRILIRLRLGHHLPRRFAHRIEDKWRYPSHDQSEQQNPCVLEKRHAAEVIGRNKAKNQRHARREQPQEAPAM